ncbi:MAG: NADH:flavin oxidoreductase [Proteobacteria bacterium]|nr:NADH:flavin oxidoreductase [Pseudomonadota bacterium]
MSIMFEPLKIGSFEIKNRFVRSATYSAVSDGNGCVTDAGIALKQKLTENDIGLIVSGFSYVLRNGRRMADMNGTDSDEQIPGYQRMTKAVHEREGRIVMQLAHGGYMADAANSRGEEFLAVSIIDSLPDFRKKARVMDEEDIETVVDAFGQSARRVQEAGFDGVQLHAAHGYLITQFLAPRLNLRTDRWGGSLENRMRFLIEIVRSIKKNVDSDFPVMAKLGVRDYLDFGPEMPVEEGVQVAAALEREGVCFIEVSTGRTDSHENKIQAGIRSPEQEAYLIDDAKAVRKAVSLPLCLVGGMRSFDVAERSVESGAVDCVSICRALIREPDLIKRWKNGDRRRAECISCWGCLDGGEENRYDVRCRHLRKD